MIKLHILNGKLWNGTKNIGIRALLKVSKSIRVFNFKVYETEKTPWNIIIGKIIDDDMGVKEIL